MMKKLLYIFMCLAMTQACIKENFPTSPNDVTEGEEITLSMSVSVPGMEVATRALGEYDQYGNSHPTLWVVAFDEQGYLVEYAKASGQESLGGKDENFKTKFQVVLHATSEPRILHFIANYAENLSLTPGHESSVIGGMAVNKGEVNEDVYWQRKVLPNGINDNQEYIKNNFTDIPLVRNFARIRVTNEATNFTLTGFYVLNVPTSGTVAPYSNGAFAEYPQNTYAALVNGGNGYIGNMPSGFENNDDDFYTNTTENSKNGNITFVAPESSFYMYENRYVGNARPITSVIIKGKFGGETAAETYYRADIITAVNASKGLADYCHILRNFDYNLVINSVDAAGRATVKEAIEASASNNLVAAVEIADLTNVTIGGAALYVSYVSKTLVSDSEIELKYKYIPDINNNPNDTANDQIELDNISGGEVIASHKVAATDVDGWRTITIQPKSPGARTAEQTITLYNQTTKIARKVTYTLRQKDKMTVECVPGNVASVAGTPVVVNIKIPQNLNPNIFPLEFAIEANTTAANNTSLKQYISPAKSENTSVRTGETIVTETNTNGTLKYAGAKSYQYIKKLSYEEYGKLSVSGTQVVLPVYFVTNTAASASTVYVSNMYFEDAKATFGNFNATYNFAELEFGGRVLPGVGNDVTFTFNMDTAAPTNQVTVTLVGLKPATGSALTQVEGTSNQYSFTPSATATNPVTLNLVTTQEYGNVSVMLSADSYVGAVATAPQDLYSFSDLAFSGNLLAKIGENVTFTFNMDTAAPNVPVTVTLVGLEPGEDSGMTRVGTTNQYTITPSATATNPAVTLNLVTTQDSGTVSVSLAAGQYNNASLSAVQKIVIPANTFKFQLSGTHSGRTIYVYLNNSYNSSIKTYSNVDSGDTNNSELDLGDQVTLESYVYFRYNRYGNDYYASATVQDLLNGTTLTFS